MVSAFLLCFGVELARAGEWEEPLSRMPLVERVPELNRTNCVRVMLKSFQSNDAVKALVFMPGATDEFYMFRRARARLNGGAPSLLDAVTALTNQTYIRASYQKPLLLLHTDEDPMQPSIRFEEAGLDEKLAEERFVSPAFFDDRDWDYLQPLIKKALHASVLPLTQSFSSWHFYRHSFAGFHLNGDEAIRCITMAGKSKVILRKAPAISWHRFDMVFEPDERVRATPKIEAFPR
jgi:hypothetical protein